MGEVAKVLGTLVGMPLYALGQLAHGVATGSSAVVEVVVDSKAGVLAREHQRRGACLGIFHVYRHLTPMARFKG